MAAVGGLGAGFLRLGGDEPNPLPPEITVEIGPDPIPDVENVDKSGKVISIKHADGSITVDLTGQGLLDKKDPEKSTEWFRNLAEELPEDVLSGIAEDLLRDIDEDNRSRTDWLESRAAGIDLLGLKIKTPNTTGATEGAPVEGMSTVKHPLLLEAVLRFQANARAELLPADGPVKIRNDDTNDTAKLDITANNYQKDFNHYLTAVAKEYYPDTDRMLLLLGLGGTTFKKIYFCPIRNRPVSDTVDAEDLIVNDSATSLSAAKRITHVIDMKPSTVKRMQILKVYRDVDLSDPVMPTLNEVERTKAEQQGIDKTQSMDPKNRDRRIYETCCELDIKGFEHKLDDTITGLEVPYKVTLDVSSRKVLAIVRHYDEDDQEMPVARTLYVKYTFVPGLGFHDIGLLHILGNTTNAVTAAWRLMLDNGMFACFPGFLFAKSGARQNTNIFRVPPGGGTPIDTQGNPINQAVMPLPYKSDGMPAMMSLVDNMVQTGQRVGGTAEMQVGEGRAEAPVGTTLALIDQAVKIMNSVHKRCHESQSEEFSLLVKCFREHPKSFWMRKCPSRQIWNETLFLECTHNCELVPRADPNTASMGQRILKVTGLFQLQEQAPQLYDPIACHTTALMSMGWNNPEQFFVPPAARAAPPPQMVMQQKEQEQKDKDAQAKLITAQAKAQEAGAYSKEVQNKIDVGHYTKDAPEQQGGLAPPDQDSMVDMLNAKAKLMDSETKAKDVELRGQEIGLKAHQTRIEDQNRDQDRAAQERSQTLELARDILLHPTGVQKVGKEVKQIEKSAGSGASKKKAKNKKS